MTKPVWRPMHAADLPEADRLGTAFHRDHPERPAIAVERLGLAPDWCFVLTEGHGLLGYCVAHPWSGARPPGLDVFLGSLPADPDDLHIHDLVIDASLRGQGFARPILAQLTEACVAAGLAQQSLVAVGPAAPFWRHQGFVTDSDPANQDFVRQSYSQAATAMRRNLSPAAS